MNWDFEIDVSVDQLAAYLNKIFRNAPSNGNLKIDLNADMSLTLIVMGSMVIMGIYCRSQAALSELLDNHNFKFGWQGDELPLGRMVQNETYLKQFYHIGAINDVSDDIATLVRRFSLCEKGMIKVRSGFSKINIVNYNVEQE